MHYGALLITLREGIEAALIVAIILTYLRQINQREGSKQVWYGVGLAVVLSVVAGILLEVVGSGFEYPAKGIYEGAMSVFATVVLTYMIFWMARQARNIKAHLHRQLNTALTSKQTLGLFLIAFAAVMREGLETALFLSAATFTSSQSIVGGGLLGLAIAVGLALLIYYGGVRLNLRTFFRFTSVLLIVFAAAILRYGVMEFQEVVAFNYSDADMPLIYQPLWNMGGILSDKLGWGAILQALVGYSSKPSVLELGSFVLYYIVVGWLVLRLSRPEPVVQQVGTEVASQVARRSKA